MARQYILESALVNDAWMSDVLVTVADDGMITEIGPGNTAGFGDAAAASAAGSGSASASSSGSAPAPPRAPVERVSGTAVPGMANAHSHAFQRAMAGNAEARASAEDSFWTWRHLMYALANRIEPEDLQVIATQLFVEMLQAGYTTVAEFHYLHRRADGGLYAGANGLWEAVDRAAAAAGVGLTFLPTLYQTSDFGSQPLKREQARFALETEAFLRAVAERVAAERHGASTPIRTGAAFHSLRAVAPDALREATLGLRSIDAALPVHIHIAEQLREVEACKLQTGRRPIEWLIGTGLVTSHWCLVHATHATAAELSAVAAAAASVCVSISTEANLGDGLFDTPRFLKLGGAICVGSDSQSTVCPAEELRWMEYQQRLRKRRRGVLATRQEPHVGTRLWRDAARAGAHAIGQPAGAIAVGRRADWVILDDAHPSMAGAAAAGALDHLLFAGGTAAIRDVMVAGRWVIKNHRHSFQDEHRDEFLRVMRRLAVSA